MPESSFKTDNPTVISLLMNEYKYIVPPYQRDYSWDKDEIDTFWDDITSAFKAGDESYFLGSMIFQFSEGNFIVIDGQQRMATITILLAVIRDTLYEIGRKKDSLTINLNYILKELENEAQIRKLKLNLINDEFFFECVQLPKDDSKRKEFSSHENLKKTNKLISKAYYRFKEKIDENIKGKNNDAMAEYLNGLSASIRKTLRVVTIVVGTEEEAYLIFETINYRGLELTVADLFKNYLIRKAPQEEREAIIRIWNEIANLLDEKVRVFLRHYWLSREEQVTERKLFGKFKKYFEEKKPNVKEFVKILKEEALIYNALHNSENSLWRDNEVSDLINGFNSLNAKQCLPLLMTGQKVFEEKEFKKLLKAVVNFTFRYSTICNLHNNILEAKYSETSIKIRKNTIKNTKEALEGLKDIYPKKDTFIASFLDKEIINSKLARYVLKTIDCNNKKYPEPINYERLTLEHILPENPDNDWLKFLRKEGLEKDTEDLIYKIGNLSLLEISMNRGAKNSLFEKKRDSFYKKSSLWLNENLTSVEKWNKEAISRRQNQLAQISERIWSVDF